MERVYNHDSMSSELMQTICQYWQTGKHCDAVIVLTSGQTIKCIGLPTLVVSFQFHKLVLLAASPRVLTRVAHTDEDGLFRMFLHGAFDHVVVRNCLKYLYEGTVTLTTANVDKILTIAELLNITSLAGHCNTFQNDGTADCDNATPIKAENEGVYKCTSEMSTAFGKKCRLSNVTVRDEEDENVKMSINDTVADALDGYSAMDEEVLANRESNYYVNCVGRSTGDISFNVKDEPAGNLDDDDSDNDDGDTEDDNDNNDDGDNDDGDYDADYKVNVEPDDSGTDEEKEVDDSTGTSPVKCKDKKGDINNRNTMSGVRMAGPGNPGMAHGQPAPQMSQDQAAMMAMSSVQGTNQLSSGIQSQAVMSGATPMSQAGQQNIVGLQPGVNQMGVANPNIGGPIVNMVGANANMENQSMQSGTNAGMVGPSQSMSGADLSMSGTQLSGQPGQQAPPLPGPNQQPTNQLQNRMIIWQGHLEWQDKKQAAAVVPGPNSRITRTLGCIVTIAQTDQEINTTSWPTTLIMQMMPQTLLNTNQLHPLFKNSRQVAFHFQNNQLEHLKNLYKVMGNGFAGCVHFPSNIPCDIRVLLLLFSNKRKSFVGLIPNDQSGVVNGIRHVITQHKQRFNNINCSRDNS